MLVVSDQVLGGNRQKRLAKYARRFFLVLVWNLAGEPGHDLDGQDDIVDSAAAGEVGNGEIEALKNGAGDMETSNVLEGFVEDVAGIEVGDDEDISAAGDGRVGEFLLGDGGIDGGVELHFAVEEDF